MLPHRTQGNIPPPRELRPYFLLDAWRGVASLWVLGFHMASVITTAYPALRQKPFYRFMWLGGLGVQLFFVISGYCILSAAAANLNRERRPITYLKARIRRIYPTYWAALLLTIALAFTASFLVQHKYISHSLLAEHLPNKRQVFVYFFSNLTLTNPLFHQVNLIGPAWTLCYEVSFYFIVGLALWGVLRYHQSEEMLLAVLHSLTLFCLLALALLPKPLPFPFDLWPEFGLGIMVYDGLLFPYHMRPRLAFMGAGIGIVALSFPKPQEQVSTLGIPVFPQYLVSWLFAATLVFLHRYDNHLIKVVPLRPLFAVGAFSYSLYIITHVLSVGIMHQLMEKLQLPVKDHYLIFLLTASGAIGFAYLFYLLFERPFISQRRQKMVQAVQKVSVESTLKDIEILSQEG
jgi:exopolysaccharide production protein ExoZ